MADECRQIRARNQYPGFRPVSVVWELTMTCNLRCRHCGSSCAEGLPDELDPVEALQLCEQNGIQVVDGTLRGIWMKACMV